MICEVNDLIVCMYKFMYVWLLGLQLWWKWTFAHMYKLTHLIETWCLLLQSPDSSLYQISTRQKLCAPCNLSVCSGRHRYVQVAMCETRSICNVRTIVAPVCSGCIGCDFIASCACTSRINNLACAFFLSTLLSLLVLAIHGLLRSNEEGVA